MTDSHFKCYICEIAASSSIEQTVPRSYSSAMTEQPRERRNNVSQMQMQSLLTSTFSTPDSAASALNDFYKNKTVSDKFTVHVSPRCLTDLSSLPGVARPLPEGSSLLQAVQEDEGGGGVCLCRRAEWSHESLSPLFLRAAQHAGLH